MTTLRLLAVLALVAGACSDSSPRATPSGPPDLPDHRGRMVTTCDLSHLASDDPLVMPGQAGASHLHAFFGNRSVDAASSVAAIADGDTTCETVADRASYWVPALLDEHGSPIEPDGADVYYRAGRGVDPTAVEPYPHGLAVIAGNGHASEPQPVSVVGWSCSANPVRSAQPPSCAGALRLRITFPDCWNGDDLRSEDHRSHMAYSDAQGCPSSHPVAVPQLELVVRYPHTGDTDGLSLSSGPPGTAHADFWNLWEPDALAREVRACINGNVVCGDALT